MTPIRPVLAGILLALLAYAGDDIDLGLDFWTAMMLSAVTSSGLTWGLAAFLIARTTGTRRQAMRNATVLLATATVTYYLMIVLISRRWSGGTLQDGSSADRYGLTHIAVMTGVWLAGSLAAGALLGILAHTVRHRCGPPAAMAAGAACGLLASESGYHLLRNPPAELMELFQSGAREFYGPLWPTDMIGLIVPMLILAWLATRHRLWPHWPALLLTAAATTVAAALLWLTTALIAHYV
ncbi:hypothetical protein [Actinoplanes couchii]|uniref:Integral membrane protein n=1 Tax=Actinoplanes couchii TaxID=403638 RepID=A0ABQ3XLS6_9ACTN|nr:hypothetical protein [Actinoplanes couchii]MDR6319352.1 hypothetical protein [Actinoplanes couchii]GID59438.1 hypothetical protein Aco03nite_078420 [Actinoplanes couchii]